MERNERNTICYTGTLRKKRLEFSEDGSLFVGGDPVKVRDAVTFFREAQLNGKIVLGLPLAFWRAAEEKKAAQIREQYAPGIAEREAKLEENKQELEEKRTESEKCQNRVADLEKQLEAGKQELENLYRAMGWIQECGLYDRELDNMRKERATKVTEATAATDALMEADKLPQSEVYSLLARLSEKEGDHAAA